MPETVTDTIAIRPMAQTDLPAVLAVQAVCYPPAMQEPATVVLQRLRAAPDTVLVAADVNSVCAYLFAYPSRLGAVTPLGAGFEPAPDPDTLYLHDLAVAPHALGLGLARRLVDALLASRPALSRAALVAVQDSRRFWEGLGFSARDAGEEGARGLATYPDGALYMTRSADRPACRCSKNITQ